MRGTILAIILGAALLPAAATAQDRIVDKDLRPLPDIRLRTPGAGVSWRAPTRTNNMMDERRADDRDTGVVIGDERIAHGFNRYPGYRAIPRGGTLPSYWSGSAYDIADHDGHGFASPGRGMRWVRYYDDALLVDRDGRVRDARYGMDFDRYGDDWGRDDRGIPIYAGGYGYGFRAEDRDRAYPERIVRDERGALDYDRDYPFEYPSGRYRRQAEREGGQRQIMIETVTTTTTPSVRRVTRSGN